MSKTFRGFFFRHFDFQENRKQKKNVSKNCRSGDLQGVVVGGPLRDVDRRPQVAGVVEGADEALREAHHAGGRKSLLVEEAFFLEGIQGGTK